MEQKEPIPEDGREVEAIFFDIRDTLGVVDRKGHHVKYKIGGSTDARPEWPFTSKEAE